MSDAKQRCFELVQAAGEQQRSIAAVLGLTLFGGHRVRRLVPSD